MYPYNPKPFDAMLAAFVCFIFAAIALLLDREWEKLRPAFWTAATIMAIITAIILFRLILEGLNDRVRVMVDFANAIAKLDPEQMAVMAYEFPTMQYRMKRGEVRALFENTNVPIETFRLFLQTSNAKYISPRRDWYTAEQPEWAWLEIYNWLVDNGKVIPDSATGNTGQLWKGSSYQQLTTYWMAGRKIVDMAQDAVYQE